jgi:hypothetical protein
LQHLVQKKQEDSGISSPLKVPGVPWHIRIREKFRNLRKAQKTKGESSTSTAATSEGRGSLINSNSRWTRGSRTSRLTVDMIQRMVDDTPKLVSPMGWTFERDGQTGAKEVNDREKPGLLGQGTDALQPETSNYSTRNLADGTPRGESSV